MKINYLPLKVLNLCFIGCGKICHSHSKRLKRLFPDINLYYASRDGKKAKLYCDKFNGKGFYNNYDDVFRDEAINVIFITTTPDTHFDLAIKSISALKNVIIEKPPFFSVKDMKEAGELANSNKVMMLIAENYYYKPLRIKLSEIIQSGVIGQPLFVNINAMKKQKTEGDWRNDESVVGFGALFEGGIHWVNFINNLGFNLTEIKGIFPGTQHDNLDRSVQLLAKSSNGTIINLFYSWEVDTLLKGIRLSKIFGTEGSITFETNGVFIFVRGKKISLKFPLANITGFDTMLKDFVAALKEGNPPDLTWNMVVKDLEIIEKVYSGRSEKQ